MDGSEKIEMKSGQKSNLRLYKDGMNEITKKERRKQSIRISWP